MVGGGGGAQSDLPNSSVTTSCRQLNFLKWAGDTGILGYIFANITELHAEYIREKEHGKQLLRMDGGVSVNEGGGVSSLAEDDTPLYERTSFHTGSFDIVFQ